MGAILACQLRVNRPTTCVVGHDKNVKGLPTFIIAAQLVSPYRKQGANALPRSNPCWPVYSKTPSESAQADSEPRASAPLSGLHLGPHSQPMRACNKAACREAVGSFVHALRRRLLIHQPQICIEVFDDEYEFSLTRWEVPLKGYASRGLKQELDLHRLVRKLDLPRVCSVNYACKEQCGHIRVHGLDITPHPASSFPY